MFFSTLTLKKGTEYYLMCFYAHLFLNLYLIKMQAVFGFQLAKLLWRHSRLLFELTGQMCRRTVAEGVGNLTDRVLAIAQQLFCICQASEHVKPTSSTALQTASVGAVPSTTASFVARSTDAAVTLATDRMAFSAVARQ